MTPARRARQPGLDGIGGGARRERAGALADDVVLRHADRRPRCSHRRRSAWPLPRADEGRLPAQPDRAVARRRSARAARGRASRARRQRQRARARAIAAPSIGSPPATGPAPASAGARSCAHASARRARAAVGAPVRLLPRRCGAARRTRRAAAGAWPADDRAPSVRARAARVRPRGIGPLRRGRGARPARARRPMRACRGRSTPSPT